ncbi:MAG TPA: phosphatidylinositol kinase [Elusimicrobia bacterium]|nr:phosphatidylinositol kinase [Elusimicrobiota bacterium]
METKRALIYYNGKKAGVLEKNTSGYIFEYDKEYVATPEAKPISLVMPLNTGKFEAVKLFPFFEGLLPEGWLLDITSKALKIDKDNKFELLLHVGKDTIGAISIISEGDILQ